MTDRLQEKSDMMFQLGALFGPLKKLTERPTEYDSQEIAKVLARFFHDAPTLVSNFFSFCKNQPGHYYEIQALKFQDTYCGIRAELRRGDKIEDVLRSGIPAMQKAIDDVPVPETSVILEAGSPFGAYRRIKELCEADTSKSLVWLDPYLDANIFTRYLLALRPEVSVTV